jgi:hypothetical protein
MKTMGFGIVSGFANADPPGWLLLLVWAAVTVTLVVCAALVALVLVRWLRLWIRGRGVSCGGWPFGLAPLDDLVPHSRYLRDQQDTLITQEEITFLDATNPSSGDLP